MTFIMVSFGVDKCSVICDLSYRGAAQYIIKDKVQQCPVKCFSFSHQSNQKTNVQRPSTVKKPVLPIIFYKSQDPTSALGLLILTTTNISCLLHNSLFNLIVTMILVCRQHNLLCDLAYQFEVHMVLILEVTYSYSHSAHNLKLITCIPLKNYYIKDNYPRNIIEISLFS